VPASRLPGPVISRPNRAETFPQLRICAVFKLDLGYLDRPLMLGQRLRFDKISVGIPAHGAVHVLHRLVAGCLERLHGRADVATGWSYHHGCEMRARRTQRSRR